MLRSQGEGGVGDDIKPIGMCVRLQWGGGVYKEWENGTKGGGNLK